jgi:hypothetical protein
MHKHKNKVIILSRMESLARYGTVDPIHPRKLQDEEYKYLFKTLALEVSVLRTTQN